MPIGGIFITAAVCAAAAVVVVRRRWIRTHLFELFDFPLAAGASVMAPFAWLLAHGGYRCARARRVLDRAGLALVRHHYYEPVLFESDLRYSLRDERNVAGLDLNEEKQFALLRQFHYRDELLSMPIEMPGPQSQEGPRQFFYHNGYFEAGDAEYLYNMIRHYKPRRIVEIGSGNSTLVARRAIEKNVEEDGQYACDHTCIEPYHAPWLERTGATIVRSRVEIVPMEIFDRLGANDILFIDSSHVIRPQADVLHEYLHVLGRLAPGVLIHVHDIFTPFDYLARFVVKERKMWNEQYLLEAFLCFNSQFEVVGALNWLNRKHRELLHDACPVLMQEQETEPASFWIRRVN